MYKCIIFHNWGVWKEYKRTLCRFVFDGARQYAIAMETQYRLLSANNVGLVNDVKKFKMWRLLRNENLKNRD